MKKNSKRRLWLYGSALVLGAGLLFVGFGITLPPDPYTRLNGAATLARLGDFDNALAECRRALKENPHLCEAHVYYAAILAEAGKHEQAAEAYDGAIRECKDDALRRSLTLDQASVYLQLGRMDKVTEARNTLLKGGRDFRIDLLDGLCAEKKHDYSGAADAYARAHADQPQDVRFKSLLYGALLRQGKAAVAAGKFSDAAGSYDKALALFPAELRPREGAARARLAQGKPEGALEVLKGARAKAPGIPALYFRAATLLLEQGKRDSAMAVLATAAAADPAGTQALLHAEPAWHAHESDEEVQRLFSKQHNSSPKPFDR